MEGQWEKEFPLLFSLEDPKKRLEFLIKIEKSFRKIIFWIVFIVIAHLIYLHAERIVLYNDFSKLGVTDIRNDSAIGMWQMTKNKLFLVALFDMVLVTPLVIYYAKVGNPAKIVKLIFNFILLAIFILFSYALAGLAVDIINIALAVNYVILKN